MITDANLCLYFTKLCTCMCIDIVEICFGNANGQISSNFDRVICPGYDSGGVLSFHVFIKFFIKTLKHKICKFLEFTLL